MGHVVASLLRNKLRSLLTMAGIAWGVASIVLIVAMGDGFREGQRNNMRQLGENIVLVFPGRTEKQAGGQRAGRRVRLDYDDIRDIRNECWLVRYVVGETQNTVTAASPFNSGSFQVTGVEPLYSRIRTIPIAHGRFLRDGDNTEGRRVCILGDNVRKQLFGDRGGVLDSQISINGLPFRIAGLMPQKSQSSDYNGLDGDKIYIPYSTMVRDMPPKDPNFRPGMVGDIIYVPSKLSEWKAARAQVLRVLGRNHRFDPDDQGAVHLWDTVEDAELVDRIFVSLGLFLGTVAVVTLTLGGVGVMNIMLISVTERTQEIGVRKAVGARRADIRAQFLMEAITLSATGGVIGIVLGAIVAFAVRLFVPSIPASLSVLWITLGVAISVSVGLFFGYYPANRAANLDPIVCLRYE